VEERDPLRHMIGAFRQVLLIQPSSAAAEHVFSLLANSFGANQGLALQDYIESSLMLLYNGRLLNFPYASCALVLLLHVHHDDPALH